MGRCGTFDDYTESCGEFSALCVIEDGAVERLTDEEFFGFLGFCKF